MGLGLSIGLGLGSRRRSFTPSDVPQAEADALIAFYDATDGNNWATNTGWKTDPVVDNWHGVTVSGGHVTRIDLSANNVDGAAGDTLAPLASSLTHLYLSGNNLSSLDVSSLTNLIQLYCGDNNISVLDVSALDKLIVLYCRNNSISVLDLSLLTDLTQLYCGDNNISVLDVSQHTKLNTVLCHSNAMTQAEVDAVLWNLYQASTAPRTASGGTINVGGSNAAPSGTHQAAASCPVDGSTPGKEVAHELANDGCAVGFNVWTTVTFTV